ncbi:MAG: hypothetical protein AAF481_17760 [Acidobacteriota bacterium]
MTESPEDLLNQVLAGESRQLKVLAAKGLLPVAPAELIPVQVALADGSDAELAEIAQDSLSALEVALVSHFLEREAGNEVIAYFASHRRHPQVMETILGRRDVSRPLLVELAESLEPDYQELLLLRQDVVVEEPAVLDALERNPDLSRYSRRRIREYREHLLPRSQQQEDEETGPVEEASDEEVAEAIEKVREEEPADSDDEAEDSTGLTDHQIRSLPVPVRLRLARGARHSLRGILVRDTNPYVAVAVVKFNAITEQEVEQIAHSRMVCEEVLEEVVRNRSWMSKYKIVTALVKNPRTPLGAAVRLVPRLAVRDLRNLTRDRNVPEPVRSTAGRLYRIKRR